MLNDGNGSRHFDIDSLPASINKTVRYLTKRIGDKKPSTLLILGSGLGSVLSTQTKFSDGQRPIKKLLSVPYSEIPGVPISTVSGHAGVLEILDYNGKIIALMRGRLHTYEGYTCEEVVRIMRALAILGLKTAIITNAAGSTCTKFGPGDIALIKDHVNMTGITPLVSDEARAIGETFIDMTDVYCKKTRKKIILKAKELGIKIKEGVYAWMRGPQYETPAEIKMLRKLGIDLVGMSTVPEVIALRQFGIKIIGISTVSNYGSGVKKGAKITHTEVKVAGTKISKNLDKILKATIQEL